MITEPALALQSAIRSALTGNSAFTALIPAASILDVNMRPSVMPCMLIGEGQTLPGGDLKRHNHEVYLDFHIWAIEPGTVFVKQAVGALRAALADTIWTIAGLAVADAHITMTRFMRDADTVHSHAVVMLCCKVQEYA
jgi:Protein of unknown function (DUF3168)